jgi:hypothetical protein
MKEELKKLSTWITIIILVATGLIVSFGLYFITAYTNLFGSFVVSMPYGVEIVLIVFILLYFAYGFITTDFREARIRYKDKNWNGELEEKEVRRKNRFRTSPWMSALILFIVVVILEIVYLIIS